MVSKAPLVQPLNNSSDWDVPLNSNFGIVTNALGSIVSVNVTNANVTLTGAQAQAMGITVGGSMIANYSLLLPAGIIGTWVITNNTSNGKVLSVFVDNGVGSPAGTGVVPPSGVPVIIFSDGTNVKLANDYLTVTVQPGFIMPFGGLAAPTGWLACDGAAYSQATYASLYAALGGASSPWGISGGNFNVPDLRGAFLRGSGGGLNPSPRNVGSYQADDVKPHNHSVTDPGHVHTGKITSAVIDGNSFENTYVFQTAAAYTLNSGTANNWLGTATTGVTINNSTGVETVPKNYAVLYCIKT